MHPAGLSRRSLGGWLQRLAGAGVESGSLAVGAGCSSDGAVKTGPTVNTVRLIMSDSDSSGPTLGERLAASRAESAARATYARPASAVDGGSGTAEGDGGAPPARRGPGAAVARRPRKDAPREVSSRRPVPFGRARCLGLDAGASGAGRLLDPRFEELCGELREEHVRRNFEFVEGLREKEREEMRKLLAKGRGTAEMRARLRKEEDELKRRREEDRREEIRKQLKREEKEKVKIGKKPWFFKESDVRERELEAKYEDLKKKGGVQKYIEKRRKRSAAKDRKLLVARRGSGGDGAGANG